MREAATTAVWHSRSFKSKANNVAISGLEVWAIGFTMVADAARHGICRANSFGFTDKVVFRVTHG
ncbi:hypothetical protein [Fulvimarina pelagi]|uniref:Potassium uptake protein KtrB n=1 Tax=Fulvimarina pelagi TaxID=217511 RepID=A0A0P0Z9P8_9HYPH|nr:hypothetical protein [Fulvimarina pelagi]BAT31036.1 potassium uptake protein KtrB [Fulvimarina pelagi]